MVTSASTRPGRPRDPQLEARAHAAAREVYDERGWNGFSLEEVARRAAIGKGSLYRRWPDKAALLVAAVHERTAEVVDADTGDTRTDLLQFARAWMGYAASDDGRRALALIVDARRFAGLTAAMEGTRYPDHIRATRAIVRRGIERGELPATTSIALIADIVAGAVGNHIAATPPDLQPTVQSQSEHYIAELVDLVLAGARSR